VHAMSSRQAIRNRTFITLLPERPARREVVERPFAAWRRDRRHDSQPVNVEQCSYVVAK
jgi:hypothetical protein